MILIINEEKEWLIHTHRLRLNESCRVNEIFIHSFIHSITNCSVAQKLKRNSHQTNKYPKQTQHPTDKRNESKWKYFTIELIDGDPI